MAKPNMAHFALAELAKKSGNGFLCLTQNVDGKSILFIRSPCCYDRPIGVKVWFFSSRQDC